MVGAGLQELHDSTSNLPPICHPPPIHHSDPPSPMVAHSPGDCHLQDDSHLPFPQGGGRCVLLNAPYGAWGKIGYPYNYAHGRVGWLSDMVIVRAGAVRREESGARKGRESPRKTRKGLEQGLRVWEAGGCVVRWRVLAGCSAWRGQGVFLCFLRVALNSRSRLFARHSCARFFPLGKGLDVFAQGGGFYRITLRDYNFLHKIKYLRFQLNLTPVNR